MMIWRRPDRALFSGSRSSPRTWINSSLTIPMTVWRGSQRFQHILPDGALAHGGDEVLDDLEVDVGFEQRATDFAHRFIDILLGQIALCCAKRACGQNVSIESVGEVDSNMIVSLRIDPSPLRRSPHPSPSKKSAST